MRILVFGDTHCPGMLKQFPNFLSKMAKKHRCKKILCVGDLVDNHALNYHERHPGLASATDEYKKAKAQVRELYRRFPDASLILGNHDVLAHRQAVSAGIPPEFLHDFGTIWDIPSWDVHPRFSFLEFDGVRYEHGDAGIGGDFGALKTAKMRFQSTIMGHLHAQAGVWYFCNGRARIFGGHPGCGLDWHLLQFEYGWKFTKKPICGCLVVLDGHPIFEPMDL